MSNRLVRRAGRYFRASVYGRLLPYLRPYKLLIAVVVVLMLAQVGFTLLDPWPLQLLIDSGLSGKPLPEGLARVFPFLAGSPYAVVVFAAVAGIALRLAGKAIDIAYDHLKSRVSGGITLAFRADLFNHMQRLSLSYHDQTSVGDSLYRLNNDTDFVSALLWGNFRHLFVSGLSLLGVVWVVFRLDWQLALLALAAAPALFASAGLYGRYFKDKSKRVKRLESASQTVLQEVLSCLRVVKAFGQEEREQRRFEGQGRAALSARLRLSLEQNLFGTGLGLILKLDSSLILLVGGFHVLAGQLTVGKLLVILAYVSQLHKPLEDIGQTLTEMQMSLASAERTLEVLDTEPEVQDAPGAKTPARVEGAVAFEGVGFAYRPNHPVLHHVTFAVPPGGVVALVGPTGAGKTTLANLLARFHDPLSGRVTLDGHDLRDLTVRTLRANIALVIQEPILFTGSLRENIAYGRPDADAAAIVAAAKAANAHDFITALPDGYDTQVGERGVRLSGGERQRVAIARAFLKDAPLLILDEPTSSVDSQTEAAIIDALDRLMVGRTTFIIAHRLSTTRRADLVIVLDRGRVVERGTPAELVRAGGLYARLYKIQVGSPWHDREVVA
jgi:ABC-type multidrug transport system fused ATPase/permease subunit